MIPLYQGEMSLNKTFFFYYYYYFDLIMFNLIFLLFANCLYCVSEYFILSHTKNNKKTQKKKNKFNNNKNKDWFEVRLGLKTKFSMFTYFMLVSFC